MQNNTNQTPFPDLSLEDLEASEQMLWNSLNKIDAAAGIDKSHTYETWKEINNISQDIRIEDL
jgi:hypothetical protein